MKIGNHLDFGATARAINLPNPAAAQDAATKAYVDALLGWKTLAAATPGAAGAVTFAPIDQSYSDLRLVFEGASHNGGSNQQWTMAVSPDGSTFSSAANITGALAGSATLYGAVDICGYRGDAGSALVLIGSLTSSPALTGGGSSLSPAWRCTGGIQGLRIALTGGATFDGGTLRLQGRR